MEQAYLANELKIAIYVMSHTFSVLLPYDYIMLTVNLSLLSLLSSEQCSQFERFYLQHVEMVNKMFSFKTKLIGSNAEASRVNRNTF